MLQPILFWGLVAGVIATIMGLNYSKDPLKRATMGFVIAGICTVVLMWLCINLFLPTFAHWSDSGPTTGFYLALIVGGIVGGFCGYREHGRNTTFVATVVVLCIIAVARIFPIGAFQIGIGPNPCSKSESQTAIAQLLNIKPVDSLDDVQESSVEKISDERSLQLAKNAQPPALQLGEYLVVDEGYEQLINGVPMNVHPMKVIDDDIAAYRRFGWQTPGFLIVDASRTDGYAQWIDMPKGEEIVYIYGVASWKNNLKRHVYFNYELPNHVRVSDLAGPEVDDNFNYWYVGTIMEPSKAGGARFYMPAGVITVNPHDGSIKKYTYEEAQKELPWLDRYLPLDAATKLVEAYAKYQSNAAICAVITTSGQWKLDGDPVTTTRGGEQLYQYFLTTKTDADPMVMETVYISPRTMEAVKFPGNGMLTVDRTSALVEKKANPGLKPELYAITAKEPTHMWFSNAQYVVYVLEQGTTFKGFGAIRSDLAKKESDEYVLQAMTIGELSRKANEQLAKIEVGSLDNQAAVAAFPITITGTVELISIPYLDGTDTKVLFTVRETVEETSTLYLFRTSARTLADGLIAEGHKVTVNGQATSTDLAVPIEVSTIINNTYPGSLISTITPTMMPIPSLTPAP